MSTRKITSSQNSAFKSALKLRSKRGRKEQGKILVEGAKENQRALASGLVLESMFVCEALLDPESTRLRLDCEQQYDGLHYELPDELFQRLVVRDNGGGGLCGVYQRPEMHPDKLRLSDLPLVVMAENIEKPGNLGALLRTADAVGADAVFLLGSHVDPFGPNSIRASLGCVFARPVISLDNEFARNFCRDRGVQVLAAALTSESCHYGDVSYKGPTAILLGSEGQGLSPYWLEHADRCVVIPMRGIADSLNVSVAGAVLMYEALRQRGLGSK